VSDDDDFFIPTGEELDRMAVEPAKPRKRGLFARIRGRRDVRRPTLDVPDAIGKQRIVYEPGRMQGDELLDKSGSTGRVVRSVDASDAATRRELIIPPELREKYGLDE